MKKSKSQNIKKYPESIGKFSIENFRVFKNETEFDFKPISFLIGPNSSGKSSLMKLLKAINHNALSSSSYFLPRRIMSVRLDKDSSNLDFVNSLPNSDGFLNFSFDLSDSFNQIEIFCRLSYSVSKMDNSLTLKNYQLKWKKSAIFEIEFLEKNGYCINLHYSSIIELVRFYLKKELEIRQEVQDSLIFFSESDLLRNLYDNVDVQGLLDLINTGESLFVMANENDNQLIKKIEKKFLELEKHLKVNTTETHSPDLDILIDRYYSNGIGDNGLAGFFRIIFSIVKNTISNNIVDTRGNINIKFSDLGEFVSNVFPSRIEAAQNNFLLKNIAFLNSPVFKRERTKVFDLNDNNATTFDIVIRSFIVQNINKIEDSHIRSYDYIDNWLIRFNMGKQLVITSLHSSNQYFTIEILQENDELISISDLGYGAGQVLSYIMLPFFCKVDYSSVVESYRIGKDGKLKNSKISKNTSRKIIFNHMVGGNKIPTKNIYLEEPETNLHPNWQSVLSELFAYQIKIGLRFVIETHSEYFVRKIQNMIAKKECDNKDVVIYYFNSDKNVDEAKGDPKVKSIFINENGGLTDNFGPGFFDEAHNLKFELLKLNKHQSN